MTPANSYQSLQKPSRLLQVTCLFWLVAKLISYKVWTTYRLFPIVPVFDIASDIPGWLHLFFYAVSLASLVILLVKPQQRLVMIILLVSELCSVLMDYTRWQPWEYQYLFILFIFLINKEDRNIKALVAFLLVALYTYSGLHKLNTGFLLQIWDNMILRSLFHMSHSIRGTSPVYYGGYILGSLELCCGLALLFKKTQRTVACLLIVMHLFNLLWLGPLGANYNIIVWPWNIAMAILLYILFISDKVTLFKPVFARLNIVVFIAWGVLPALNIFGYWDHYLSGSLYSGKLPLMGICTNGAKEFKPFLSDTDKYQFCAGKPYIKLQSWAMKELNVPPYPQERIYYKIAGAIYHNYPGSSCFIYTYGDPLKREIKE